MCSSTPDPDPLIGQSAMANVELAKQAMAYYRERDAAQAPRQEKMDDLTTQLAEQGLATSKQQDAQAQELWRRYQETGVPMENAMMRDASGYDSIENQNIAAGQAATDVSASMAAAGDAQRRTMARMGVNPADGRSLSMERDAANTGALATAGAMNNARADRQKMGIMLRKDAAGAARGMPGTAAQTYGVASAAGGQAAGAVGSAIGSANSTAATLGVGFNTAIGANNSAGSILAQQYRDLSQSTDSGNSSTMQGVGSLAAAAAMAY